MYNLYKTGFQSLNVGEPYILDTNGREIRDNRPHKVIRPIDEKNEEDDDPNGETEENKALLNDAMEKADIVIQDARQQAEKIISDAEIEADAVREQARTEGYEQGLAEGVEAAKQQIDDHMRALEEEKDAAVSQKESEMLDRLAQTQRDIVDISCNLIEKLTGILVNDFKPVMLHMINNALNASESSKQFIIRVSGEIYPYIEDNRDRIIGSANPGVSVEIFGDSKLSSGQCLIESENGIVDLSMDVQVKNLITAIKLLSE